MSEIPPPYPQQPPPPSHPEVSLDGPHDHSPTAAPSTVTPGFGAGGSVESRPDIRPQARWFWIGGVIMVGGVLAAIAFGVLSFFGIADTVDDFPRVARGTDTVVIESSGEYVIYAEDGTAFATVEVLTPDGEPVPTSPYLTGLSYDFNGRSGQAASTFEAEATGPYVVTTDTDIAIGPSIAGDLLRTILIPFVVAGLAVLLGLIVIIVTAVRRSGAKKRAAFAR